MTEPSTVSPKEGPEAEPPLPWLEELPPSQIVAELDRFIVGQSKAKRAIAIAIRNRWRRIQAPETIRDEITPSNIILIGPTGVGKTEIARRLARLAGAPFLKVEASKFTEVGYVGRDVESLVRDLVDVGISLVRAEREEEVLPQAEERALERVLDLLLPPLDRAEDGSPLEPEDKALAARQARSREKLKRDLTEGKLDDREVELELTPMNYPDPDAFRPPAQTAEDSRGAQGHRGRRAAADGRHGRCRQRSARPGRESRHRLHRRDRQGGRRAQSNRPRRLA
jgi:ATP-dependent HslUV protease ATP-binding subunit HslU